MQEQESVPDWAHVNKGGTGRPKNPYYKWDTVEKGASFLVPKAEQRCTLKSFREMTSSAAKRLGRKFYVREVPETGDFECWRAR